MIPKIVYAFYEPYDEGSIISKRYLDNWKEFLSDKGFEFKILTLKDLFSEDVEFPNYLKCAIEKKLYYSVADWYRIYKIWQTGGIWIDTDVFFHNPIPESFLENDFFIVNSGHRHELSADFFGSEKNNEYLEFILKQFYKFETECLVDDIFFNINKIMFCCFEELIGEIDNDILKTKEYLYHNKKYTLYDIHKRNSKLRFHNMMNDETICTHENGGIDVGGWIERNMGGAQTNRGWKRRYYNLLKNTISNNNINNQ